MKIAIVGAGSIGVAWTIVFARAGHDVALYDVALPLRSARSGAGCSGSTTTA
jgi:L-gulonate 3-dehydrogenase